MLLDVINIYIWACYVDIYIGVTMLSSKMFSKRIYFPIFFGTSVNATSNFKVGLRSMLHSYISNQCFQRKSRKHKINTAYPQVGHLPQRQRQVIGEIIGSKRITLSNINRTHEDNKRFVWIKLTIRHNVTWFELFGSSLHSGISVWQENWIITLELFIYSLHLQQHFEICIRDSHFA